MGDTHQCVPMHWSLVSGWSLAKAKGMAIEPLVHHGGRGWAEAMDQKSFKSIQYLNQSIYLWIYWFINFFAFLSSLMFLVGWCLCVYLSSVSSQITQHKDPGLFVTDVTATTFWSLKPPEARKLTQFVGCTWPIFIILISGPDAMG